jgi:hypothetical protein
VWLTSPCLANARCVWNQRTSPAFIVFSKGHFAIVSKVRGKAPCPPAPKRADRSHCSERATPTYLELSRVPPWPDDAAKAGS